MQKLTILFTMSAILLNTVAMQSMEIDYKEQTLIPDFAKATTGRAEKHNQNNPIINFIKGLFTLPDDLLKETFYSNLTNFKPYNCAPNFHPGSNRKHWNRVQQLETRIKYFMRLSTVCKQLNIL